MQSDADARQNVGYIRKPVGSSPLDSFSLRNYFELKQILGCVSLGESKIGFLIRDHTDSLLPKKREIRKWIFFFFA